MGYGDWILASADVKEANIRTGKKVFLGDGKNFYKDEQVFLNNPRMASPGDDAVWINNYSGSRPYISRIDNKRLIFNDDYSAKPGEIFLAEDELLDLPESPYIVIEPNVKSTYKHGMNKSWPYWSELTDMGLPFIQLGMGEKPLFNHVQTKTFRRAMAVLSKAALFVGTDGGLHHAAAALGVPAVVIWTGFSSPRHLGYDTHINIHDGSEPCGTYSGICQHCVKKAKAISPEEVKAAIKGAYEKR